MGVWYNISHEFNGFFPSNGFAFLLGPGRGERLAAGAVERTV